MTTPDPMTTNDDAVAAREASLAGEVQRLRREVSISHAVSASALSRATRLAQVISALVQLTDPDEILDRAATEVAEQFAADVAVFLVPAPAGDKRPAAGAEPAAGAGPDAGAGPRFTVAAHWGIASREMPGRTDRLPSEVDSLDPARPLLAGSAAELVVPDWLAPSEPRHLAWGLLAVRGERIGYLLLARRGDEPFTTNDVKDISLVVSRIALAVDNGRLYSRTQEQVRRLRRLHEVTAALAGTLDMDRVVSSLASTVVEEVPVAGAAIYLARQRGLELAARAGAAGDAPARIADHAARSDDPSLLLMGVGGPPVGALRVTGRPEPGTEADGFLQHLADLGSLIIGKSLLFERIRTQAESDPLTGLPNRALLMQRLESACARSREAGTDLATIFVDLDDFKAVNDTYGHDVGDQLLVDAAGRLTDTVGPGDTVARLGGDEFVVVRVDIPDANAALAAAEQIRAAMAIPFELGDVVITNQASVGIALASTSNYHPKTLMRDADAGMYADKLRERPRARIQSTGVTLPRLLRRPQGPGRGRIAPISLTRPENLRAWCEAWVRSAARGLDAAAAEAVQRILSIARDQLDVELTWLSRFTGDVQTFDMFEGDPSPFGLSRESEVKLAESYCVRALDGRLPHVIPDTRADERTRAMSVTEERGFGAYIGVPVYAGNGELYGMLCGASGSAVPSLRDRDAKVLRMLADVLTEPLASNVARDAQTATFVHRALSMLDAGGLSIDLQPIVDLATGETASVEALARFASYPYSVEGWFTQAHLAGCGEQLELDAAILAHEYLPALPSPVSLAINASPDVASAPEFLSLVTRTDPTRIVVEITEHRQATEPRAFASSIRRLQAHGVQVAIDDAGTGYSDLRQILELQPDIIKLDRALVCGAEDDPVKLALVQAIVAFAKNTGVSLVAEGVSRESTADLLRELRVDYGQGFALSPPEPAASVIRRL